MKCGLGLKSLKCMIAGILVLGAAGRCHAQEVEGAPAASSVPTPPKLMMESYCFEAYCTDSLNTVYMYCTYATGQEEATAKVLAHCRMPACGINGELVISCVGHGAECGMCRDCATGPGEMTELKNVFPPSPAQCEIDIAVCCCDGVTLHQILPAPISQCELCEAIQTMRCVHARRHGGARWVRWTCRPAPLTVQGCCR